MLVRWFAESSSAALSTATENLQYLWPASRTSTLLGVSSALVALVMALPVAALAVRGGGRFARLIERSTYLSFALPDLVAAIALSYGAVHFARFLYGSFGLIVFAEAILFLPFAVVAMRATLGQIEPALEDSARALGAGPLSTFRRVTLPVARPGVVAALVLVFAFSLGDLASAQVLLPLDLYTLGTEFQSNSGAVSFASAAPFAAVLILLAMAAAWVLMSSFGTVRAFSSDDERG
jgi:iron(III) transport system permease protein